MCPNFVLSATTITSSALAIIARLNGLEAAVLCPVGFLCDHIEVLYDLDHEAAAIAAAIGLPMVRAEAVNDDPAFLDALCEAVLQVRERYARGIGNGYAAGQHFAQNRVSQFFEMRIDGGNGIDGFRIFFYKRRYLGF